METRNSPYSNNEDRISNLPDTLIHHILSFIDKKYAVQTSVLSRRWRYIWTSLPTLNFDDGLVSSPKAFDFVDRVLDLRDSSDIQGFHLLCRVWDCDIIRSHLYTWIPAAVRRNVVEFSIDIFGDPLFQFSQCLFTCKSLTKLVLEMGGKDESKIILPNSMDLPRLKYLKLGSLSIYDEKLTDKLFPSCPSLESLILIDTRVTDSDMNLNISSLKLKHFELDSCYYFDSWESGIKTVKLYAPNLTSFSCKDFMSQDYSLENLSSLVTADITMVIEEDYGTPEIYSSFPGGVKELYAQCMMKFLTALYNVKDLALSSGILKVIYGAPEILDSQPQFCNLRSLKLETWLSIDCIHAITYLLKTSPNIETLSLKLYDERQPPLYPF